jgi:hypothetical protein
MPNRDCHLLNISVDLFNLVLSYLITVRSPKTGGNGPTVRIDGLSATCSINKSVVETHILRTPVGRLYIRGQAKFLGTNMIFQLSDLKQLFYTTFYKKAWLVQREFLCTVAHKNHLGIPLYEPLLISFSPDEEDTIFGGSADSMFEIICVNATVKYLRSPEKRVELPSNYFLECSTVQIRPSGVMDIRENKCHDPLIRVVVDSPEQENQEEGVVDDLIFNLIYIDTHRDQVAWGLTQVCAAAGPLLAAAEALTPSKTVAMLEKPLLGRSTPMDDAQEFSQKPSIPKHFFRNSSDSWTIELPQDFWTGFTQTK